MDIRDYPTSRRAVLGGLAALGAAPFVLRGAWAFATDVDVIIVGAGAAGIGAAIALKQAGLTARILEADNRIGGRALTDTTTFRGKDGKAVPFDIGCAWIHRFETGDPFADWSRKLHFDTQAHDLGVNRLFYGKTPYSDLMVRFLDEDEDKAKKAFAGAGDVPASSVITDWDKPMDAAATYMGPMDMGVDFDSLSTADFTAMDEYDPNYLVREGYGTLVKTVGSQSGLDIVLNAPVTAIDTGGSGVKVTIGGRHPGALTARAVIVTVSTGVLASGAIRFPAGLPPATQDAIGDVPMGLLAKIPLQIPGISHYLDGVQPYYNLLQENAGLDDIYFLAWPWNSDLMVGFVGGKFGWDLSRKGQAAAIAYAKDKLSNIFGSDIKRRVRRGLLTPWATNPLARGAYSAARPGKHASRAVLAQPVHSRLFFAGEATAPGGMFATCSGAYSAGTQAASRIAALLKAG
ncbi:MAG: NAD(P)/FAD-dependent oxidoreductase [Rhizomicrobium sp.]